MLLLPGFGLVEPSDQLRVTAGASPRAGRLGTSTAPGRADRPWIRARLRAGVLSPLLGK